MKAMKKILALVIGMIMVMGITAMAATITINRDDSWKPTADLQDGENNEATYTYYKIFDAEITSAAGVNAETGEKTGEGNVVYTLTDEAKVNALPAIFKADKAAGNDTWYISLVDESTGASDIVAALKTMVESNTTLFPGTATTTDDNPVTLTVPGDGYYLILASNGKDAAVQTIGNVEIKEKNDYPTIDKKQRKANGTYADTTLPQEIGSYIDYQLTVHIPADANKQIAVIDKMSSGLEYDSTTGLTLNPNVTYSALEASDAGYDASATWQIKFPANVVAANRGNDIVITYRAKVTEAALTDSDKENEVTLNYDESNYILKDKVEYETYFAGIYKVDPADANADMAGVKFTLALADGTAVNVTWKEAAGYYVVDPESTSNEVETRVDGGYYTIKIRGLDNDKDYKLTETETIGGYNLLKDPVTLTKVKDEDDAFSSKAANTFDKVENNKGSQLPSTGGIGTTIFYVIGAILVIGAGILLVTKKRMSVK